ncbi:MAG: acyl-CoA dehydrogenase family protein [Syntrophomonadaceae bacterium]|nr:acyl-CoA dehydrogenase family protein [Syntrophomonadaceae bacterium]
MAIGFELTGEQKLIANTVYKWAVNWLEPKMEKADEEDHYPEGFFQETAKLGLNGLVIEEKYGGAGQGYTEALICTSELGRVSNALAMSWGAHLILCADNIRRNASEELKMKYLPPLCDGRAIGCLGITESNAGSDAMSLRTSAKRDGDSWIINGNKIFITNAPIGQTLLFYAKTAPEKGAKGMSAFIMEIDPAPQGYTCNKLRKFGMRTSPTGELGFDGVRIPAGNLVGEENKAVNILTSGLATERITLSGCALGSAKAAIDLSAKYAKERAQFGKPIAEQQAIQHKLADMYVRYETGRLLAFSAAAFVDAAEDKHGGKGTDLDMVAASSLLYCGEISVQNCLEGVQIHGGYGYCLEFPIQRHLRDTKLWDIGAGTSEVRRNIIARELLRKY